MARARLVEPGEQREQRRFAGARRADDGDRFPAPDREADVIEDGQRSLRAANLLAQTSGFENGLRCPWLAYWSLAFCLLAARRCRRGPPDRRSILVVGDSLSAGYGIELEQGWVALLQQRSKNQGYGHRVVNASVSGETTDGGVARLAARSATHRPGIVILELGGNDGLRGLPVARVQANFEPARSRKSRAAGAQVLLLGMQHAAELRAAVRESFQTIYDELAGALQDRRSSR